MTGRLINRDGKFVDVPSAQFGHLSMIPLALRTPDGVDQESFAGRNAFTLRYSGSPVYVDRGPYDLRTGNIMTGGLSQLSRTELGLHL